MPSYNICNSAREEGAVGEVMAGEGDDVYYFKKLNVDFVGRFGSWAYLWSDQCFMSGKATAQKILRESLNK